MVPEPPSVEEVQPQPDPDRFYPAGVEGLEKIE
jgi:hypothetical protein